MTDAALRATDALLDAALNPGAAGRRAFLDGIEKGPLRTRARRLVEAAEGEDALLDRAPVSVAEGCQAAGTPGPTAVGERVGPHRISEPLGEGGMGRVYSADRADGAFDRTVALDLVRRSPTLRGSTASEWDRGS